MDDPRKRRKERDVVASGREDYSAETAAPRSGAHGLTHASGTFAILDVEKYRRHVAHLGLPEDRADELLQSVWEIMRSFVDRAFGDDPVQLVRKDGEERNEEAESTAPSVVECQTAQPLDNKEELSGTFRQHTAESAWKETR